jgi:hypothetical protein
MDVGVVMKQTLKPKWGKYKRGNEKMSLQTKNTLFKDIKALLHNARAQVVRTVNSAMVNTCFEIGKLIVEHEQKGHDKALYREGTLKELSNQLSVEFGKGFSVANIQQMRSCYLALITGGKIEDKLYRWDATAGCVDIRDTKDCDITLVENAMVFCHIGDNHYVWDSKSPIKNLPHPIYLS